MGRRGGGKGREREMGKRENERWERVGCKRGWYALPRHIKAETEKSPQAPFQTKFIKKIIDYRDTKEKRIFVIK